MSKITLFGIKSLFVDFNQARHPKISNNRLFRYLMLLLLFAPPAIYLLLISVVLAWPNVMTLRWSHIVGQSGSEVKVYPVV